jgi:hypothetical protein
MMEKPTNKIHTQRWAQPPQEIHGRRTRFTQARTTNFENMPQPPIIRFRPNNFSFLSRAGKSQEANFIMQMYAEWKLSQFFLITLYCAGGKS